MKKKIYDLIDYLKELDYKYLNSQLIEQKQDDLLMRECREKYSRLQERKELHDNYSKSEIKAIDESNYNYFK